MRQPSLGVLYRDARALAKAQPENMKAQSYLAAVESVLITCQTAIANNIDAIEAAASVEVQALRKLHGLGEFVGPTLSAEIASCSE